ncbi:MAG: LTA synthase family protein [Magnetococcales bacterium]|nr:LTA synthase family protein [Magnetococcales bacterium]
MAVHPSLGSSPRLFSHPRYQIVALLSLVYLVTQTVERLVYVWRNMEQLPDSGYDILGIFGLGLIYDLLTVTFLIIPPVVALLVAPDRIFRDARYRWLVYLFFYLVIFGMLFENVAQWIFWEEFTSRFNFIAVDYLVYTHEVLGNIRESYPLPLLLSSLGIAAFVVTRFLQRPLSRIIKECSGQPGRLKPGLALLSLPVISFFCLDHIHPPEFKSNRIAQELAGNSIHNLFAAFFDNRLDYNIFYSTIPMDAAFALMRKEVGAPPTPHPDQNAIIRRIRPPGPELHRNVVLITVESLSAEFLGAYGDRRGLTPNLDALAAESLLFEEIYATGTRTVRGLEALTLSIPPTPGQSLLRRPNNDHLFSSGFLFKQRGYDVRFIYGGHGYFDNMNTFFSGNGFEIVDRGSLSQEEIHFANIWGVADEDLLDRVLKESDISHARGKPFFHLVMTTSNHRPFTYPDGRIDIPSHSNRDGGVKYTDYAIGRFMREAKNHPWYDHTIFVIIADHCASSAGKVDLAANKHHIPWLMVGPGLLTPRRVPGMASQIDVMPTMLGLLNFSYDSKFFGKDLLANPELPGRALLGNYQKLGYLHGDQLTILSPRQLVETFRVHFNQDDATRIPVDEQDRSMAIAYYQTASHEVDHGHYGAVEKSDGN